MCSCFFSLYILHLAYTFVTSRKLVILLAHSVTFLPPKKLKPRSPKSNETQLNQIVWFFSYRQIYIFPYGHTKSINRCLNENFFHGNALAIIEDIHSHVCRMRNHA